MLNCFEIHALLYKLWSGGGALEEWGDQTDREENNYSFTAE